MACPEPQTRRTPTSQGRYPGTSRRCTRFQERKAAAAHCLDLPTGCGIVCVCVCPGAQCGPAPHPSWSTSTVLCDALVILPAMVDKMPNVDVGGGARFRHAVPSTVTVDANLFPMSTAGGAEKGVKELEATHTPRGTQAGWLAGWLAALPRILAPSTDQRAASRGTVGLVLLSKQHYVSGI